MASTLTAEHARRFAAEACAALSFVGKLDNMRDRATACEMVARACQAASHGDAKHAFSYMRDALQRLGGWRPELGCSISSCFQECWWCDEALWGDHPLEVWLAFRAKHKTCMVNVTAEEYASLDEIVRAHNPGGRLYPSPAMKAFYAWDDARKAKRHGEEDVGD